MHISIHIYVYIYSAWHLLWRRLVCVLLRIGPKCTLVHRATPTRSIPSTESFLVPSSLNCRCVPLIQTRIET